VPNLKRAVGIEDKDKRGDKKQGGGNDKNKKKKKNNANKNNGLLRKVGPLVRVGDA
jgi:hypothetical protein